MKSGLSDRAIYLGVDIGTTSAKCLAVACDGSILATGQHSYGISRPREGWAEQDPADLKMGLARAVRQCMQQLADAGRTADHVTALALSTQGDTLIMTDDSGQALRPAISWMDSRGMDECRQTLAATGQEFWYEATKHRLTPFRSICSILWMAKNEPHCLSSGRMHWVPDYLSMWLTGRSDIDTPSASWTPFHDPSLRAWSRPVLEMAGLDESSLPSTVESGELIGEMLPDAAAELGLKNGARLVGGAFDQAAAAHGAGAVPGGRSVLSCGTSWVLYAVSSKPVSDPDMGISACCHVRSDEWGLVLPFTGGSAYDWTAQVLAGERACSDESANEPLIFVPHLYGGLCPDWRAESRGTIAGLSLSHTSADIELAIMRGIGFEARRNMEACARIAPQPDCVRMVGGATRSAFWPQMIADILAVPVELWECAESACYGAARLAAGEVSAAWTGGAKRTLEPRPDRVDVESELYGRYLTAYRAALDYYGS